MDAKLEETVKAVRERFGAELHEYQVEVTLFFTPETIVPAATALRDEFGFKFFIDASVDYWPEQELRFTCSTSCTTQSTTRCFACGCP